MARVKLLLLINTLIFISVIAACDSQNKKLHPIEDLPQRQMELKPKEVESVSSMLHEIMDQAKLGLVKECEFNSLDSTMAQVKEQWGEPDHVDLAGAGYYATYGNKKVSFGYNEEGQIFDVRSYSKELQEIGFLNIEETLGRPNQNTKYNNDNIYTYDVNSDIQLKFVVSKTSDTVDHISIFNPQRTKTEKNKYLLEIKGKSNQLSGSAWTKMLNWRKQIVNFSTGQKNVYINGPNQKRVALTFDDGPDAVTTSGIIDILAQYDVRGNFFFLGKNVERYPMVVKKAYEKGNLILSHSYNHADLSQLDRTKLEAEMEKAESAIESVIGKRPAILRPPYGETDAVVASRANEKGYTIVLWSIDTLDWSQKEASNIVKNVIENVRNGDIILMHSGPEHSETKKALPLIIEELQKRNYEMVGLDTLLKVEAYQ